MTERDIAHYQFKQSNLQEDLRAYRHLKNRVNSMISKEKFKRKCKTFQNEELNTNQKWKLMKQESGQNKNISPPINL